MLRKLKVINWPNEIIPTGHLISGKLLGYVSDYSSMIDQAHQNASVIINEALDESERIAEAARSETAKAVRSDVERLFKFVENEHKKLVSKSSELCLEVTKVAIENFVNQIEDKAILEKMILSLVNQSYSTTDFIFQVNPTQQEITEAAISSGLRHILGTRDYKIVGDSKINIDHVRLICSSGAYVEISRANLVQIFTNELEELTEYFKAQIASQVSESINESENRRNDEDDFSQGHSKLENEEAL